MNKLLLAAVPAVLLMQGCVVWDIRNEMRNANARLGDVKTTLDGVNGSLDKANTALSEANSRLDGVEKGLVRLDRTNSLIDGVGKGLTRIDTTNTALDGLEKQLALLASIEQSLGRLDAHLASVRKTIGSIDSMIPFLDLGGGEEVVAAPATTPAPTSTPAPGAQASATPAERPAGEPAAPEAEPAGRRDLIVGAWVCRYPESSRALVLLADGRYLSSAADVVVEGTWTREGTKLTLTSKAAPVPATGASTPAAGSTPSTPTTPSATPAPSVFEVVSSTTRALTLRSEQGRLVIYGRP